MTARPSQEWSANFTRPNDTTAYAAADLVANSTTAGSVTQLSWSLPGACWLRKITLRKSGSGITNADFRLWLHTDSAVSFTNGDNGALSIASSSLDIASVLGVFNVTVEHGATNLGSEGYATFDCGLYPLAPATIANGRGTIYGFLEARGIYTPIAQEVFTVILRGEAYT